MAMHSTYSQEFVLKAVALGKKKGKLWAANELGVPPRTLGHWMKKGLPSVQATRQQIIDDALAVFKKHGPDTSVKLFDVEAKYRSAYQTHWARWAEFRQAVLRKMPASFNSGPERVFAALKDRSMSVEQLSESLSIKPSEVMPAMQRATRAGYNIHMRNGLFQIEKIPAAVEYDPALHLFESDANGVIRYGIVTDNHIGSKYARLDVLNEMYDLFQREGITRVYNCGNWIDGEARFNRHDLEPWAHGMDNQLRGFVKHYPIRDGITTYYVAGDDHEGWYDGVDIGTRALQTARDAGRTDLRYIGYMEAFIRLRNKSTGNGSVMAVVHPGGGSSYALSYAPQKIVESYQGGEKPAVVNLGHYHKMDVFNYRNVWIVQGGCTQDQTPFMRKKRIEAHVGGVIVELVLDDRGAVTDFKPWMKRFFDRSYYNYQFDRANDIRPTMVPA